MNISPINGYEIKHREAEKLSEDIEKFLNGRKVKVIESTFKPKKPREECKPFKPEVNWRYKPNKKKVKSEVIIEQSTLLAKYLSVTPFYKRWANLLEKADHVVSLGEIKKWQAATMPSQTKGHGLKLKMRLRALFLILRRVD